MLATKYISAKSNKLDCNSYFQRLGACKPDSTIFDKFAYFLTLMFKFFTSGAQNFENDKDKLFLIEFGYFYIKKLFVLGTLAIKFALEVK